MRTRRTMFYFRSVLIQMCEPLYFSTAKQLWNAKTICFRILFQFYFISYVPLESLLSDWSTAEILRNRVFDTETEYPAQLYEGRLGWHAHAWLNLNADAIGRFDQVDLPR